MSYYGMGDYYLGDYYRGDPGLLGKIFGGIKGAVGGFLKGGPLGAIGGAIKGAAGAGGRRPPPLPQIRQIQAPVPYSWPQGPGTIMVPVPGITGGVQRLLPGGASGYEAAACPRGFRPNKSAYWLKSGERVEKGTKCVRVRRLNVANVRALRRGIRRAAGFAKIARRVITISRRFKKSRRRR